MPEKCLWIVFHAHPTRFEKSRDHHPDFLGVFVCAASRREPEQLLGEVLANRKLFLAEIRSHQLKPKAEDWGMNERLKTQFEEEGFGLSLTKMHHLAVPLD